MKLNPLHNREKMSQWYALKGISWHITVLIFLETNVSYVRNKSL